MSRNFQLREIEESLEKLARSARRYIRIRLALMIMGGVLLLILGIGGFPINFSIGAAFQDKKDTISIAIHAAFVLFAFGVIAQIAFAIKSVVDSGGCLTELERHSLDSDRIKRWERSVRLYRIGAIVDLVGLFFSLFFPLVSIVSLLAFIFGICMYLEIKRHCANLKKPWMDE